MSREGVRVVTKCDSEECELRMSTSREEVRVEKKCE